MMLQRSSASVKSLMRRSDRASVTLVMYVERLEMNESCSSSPAASVLDTVGFKQKILKEFTHARPWVFVQGSDLRKREAN